MKQDQVTKFANSSQVCLFSLNETKITVQLGFRQGLRHYCLLRGLPARICHYRLYDKNVQNRYFLLSRIKRLHFSFWYWQILPLPPMKNHVTRRLFHQSSSAYKNGGYRE